MAQGMSKQHTLKLQTLSQDYLICVFPLLLPPPPPQIPFPAKNLLGMIAYLPTCTATVISDHKRQYILSPTCGRDG